MSLNGIILLKSVKNYTENLLKSGIGMLYRKIETVIEEHLKSDSKKILLIDGARQVGKTYIIRYVGKKIFKNFIEINMVEDSLGNRLFDDITDNVCFSDLSCTVYEKNFLWIRLQMFFDYGFNLSVKHTNPTFQ